MKEQILDNIKKSFVEESINNGNYKELPKFISKGKILRIPGFGNIEEHGFEHGFLYFEAGSEIIKHLNLNSVLQYRVIFGDNKIQNKIYSLGDIYSINNIECDTLIEYFEVNRINYYHTRNYIKLKELLQVELKNKYNKLNDIIYNIKNEIVEDINDHELYDSIKKIYFSTKGKQKIKTHN